MASQLEAFFTHGAAPCGEPPSQRSSTTSVRADKGERDELLYVHAATDAGLTSLLLQFGFTRAQQGKSVVLILCGDSARSHKPTIVPLQPCLCCGLPTKTGMDNEIWRRIQIKYIRTSHELQNFACSLHLMRGDTSSVLLVDSFDRFFTDQSTGAVYQTLALLYEARRFMATATGFGEVVLASPSHAFMLQDQHHRRLHRWCRFLQISSDADEFILHEEIHVDEEDEEDEENENENEHDETMADVAIRFEFTPPAATNQPPEGSFRLCEVIYRH